MAKRVFLMIALAISAASLLYFGYRDTSTPPQFSADAFQGASLQEALQTISDATHDGGAPGVILLVRQNGADTIATAGIADKVTERPMPSGTALRIASISKLYTASLALTLSADGKLDLDAPISAYLSAETLVGVANGSTVTARQLLQHMGGIPDYYDLRTYLFEDWENTPISLERMLPVLKRKAATSASGEQYAYSDMGYILLGGVIEAIANRPLPDLLNDTITAPMAFRTTHYNQQHSDNTGIHGYGSLLRPWADTYDRWDHSGPAAGMTASASETAQFLDALFLATDGPLTATGAQMIADTVTLSPTKAQGLGPHILTLQSGETMIGHSGDVHGYQSFAYALPAPNAVIFGHINCDCDDLSAALLWNTYNALIATTPNQQSGE